MKTNKRQLEKYYDKRASCQVLGCLMKNPYLLKDKKFILDINDFPIGIHQNMFICIYNLALQDLKEIKISDIEIYLHTNDPKAYTNIFEVEKNLEWLHEILADANVLNYEYYYNKIKKLSLLRDYIIEGIDVTDLMNVDEIDHIIIKQQQEKLEMMSLIDIQQYFDKKIFNIKEKFIIRDDTKRRKAGDKAEELFEQMKQSPSYGYGLESDYLNAITMGALGGMFFLETRDSGCGKSRVAIKRLINMCSPEIWDFKQQDFIRNPNGQDNAGLYLGTEMNLYKEIEPMMWAFISGVEQYKIKKNILTKEEEQRVKKAIEINKRTRIFLEDESNYDVNFLWNIFDRYKTQEGIVTAGIDYLELTSGLISEYAQLTRGMSVREDQVLLNLSANIKNICTKFDVSTFGYTQTTDEARRDGVRDQRAVKGARSLPNKTDVGITVFEPTKKELELLQPLIKKNKGFKNTIIPNIGYTIYKNRGGEIKDVKVWAYQNLGNMEIIDLFCTNKYYEPISVDKVHIDLSEDHE